MQLNQRYREVFERLDEIFDEQEYLEALNQRPHDWEIYVKDIPDKPETWIEAEHGPFPKSGKTQKKCVRCHLSKNRSKNSCLFDF